jgi:hypothetical protein
MRLPPIRMVTFLALAIGIWPSPIEAQPGFYRFSEGRHAGAIRPGLPEVPGGFTFCRLIYSSNRTEERGLGWSTDYPNADRNLTLRMGELTTATTSLWADGEPGIAALSARDPNLFRCPFLFSSDVGTAAFSAEEVETLREYFAKGGFLWVDDFWGERAWSQWSREIGRVLPDHAVVELPMDHPLFRIVYSVREIPQIPSIQFWRSTGGLTSERGAESAIPTLRAILDESGRILVVMTHNTDIADGWEREMDDDTFFLLFSPDAYALGVNILVWMLTH